MNAYESTVCRTTQKIENSLIRSGVFSLPGKKELRQKGTEEKVVAMDVTESPIEKPKENQKNYYSGKQKEQALPLSVCNVMLRVKAS